MCNKKRVFCLILALLFLVLILSQPITAVAATQNKVPINRAVGYLVSIKNPDGGFPYLKGGNSSSGLSDWIVMALIAAGEDLKSTKWDKGGRTPLDYISTQTTQLDSTTDYARKLLALSAGQCPTVINGIDLVQKLCSFQNANGQFAQYEKGEQQMINAHIWAILAVASVKHNIPQQDKAKEWLVAKQNKDGGFSWAIGGESDPDTTGAALMALVILGEKSTSPSVSKAVNYLNSKQNNSGGIEWTNKKANTATDSWVIQGLLAVGEELEGQRWKKDNNSIVDHLLGLQDTDGSFCWIEGKKSNSVMMTAYAIMALSQKPIPVNVDFNNLAKQKVKISIFIDSISTWVNNEEESLDVPPMIINSRTMVPLRFVSEKLGAKVYWMGDTQKVIIVLDGIELSLSIGKTGPGLDTPAELINGRTMVPIRYVSEKLGAKVTWYGLERRVQIEK